MINPYIECPVCYKRFYQYQTGILTCDLCKSEMSISCGYKFEKLVKKSKYDFTKKLHVVITFSAVIGTYVSKAAYNRTITKFLLITFLTSTIFLILNELSKAQKHGFVFKQGGFSYINENPEEYNENYNILIIFFIAITGFLLYSLIKII